MCGRYYVDEETNQELLNIVRNLDKRLQGTPSTGQRQKRIKTGEIYPSDTVAVISQGQKSACYVAMTWGYQLPNKSSLIINARSESAHEKPMFSKSLSNHRIVVPANGFFEWTHDGKKHKYYFTAPNGPMIYMAGLAKYQEASPHFVIITTKANESMEDIHNRMPVLLYKDEIPDFLANKEQTDYYMKRKPYLLKRELFDKAVAQEEESNPYSQLQLPL